MTLLIDEIIDEEVIAELEKIKVDNGFENDVTVLDGFFKHYINDLLENRKNVGFPCVVVQEGDEIVTSHHDNIQGELKRNVSIIGAVDARKKDTARKRLNSLLYDVRRAVCIDYYGDKAQAEALQIGNVSFETQDSFAFFEQKITITYYEKWK